MDGDGYVNKKRPTEWQLTKEDCKDDDIAEQDTGGFARAPEEELKTRQIRRARRGPPPTTTTTAPNPFAAISLTTPTKTTPPLTPTDETQETLETKNEEKDEEDPTNPTEPTPSQPEPTDTDPHEDDDQEKIDRSKNGETSQPSSIFGTPSSTFAFTSSATQSQSEQPVVFDPSKFKPLDVVTSGEESEETLFSESVVLFTNISGSWKSTGKGTLKINVTESKMARLLMRQDVTLKLVLNAWLYPGMKVVKMADNAVTFSCQNAVGKNEEEEATEKKYDILALRFGTEAAEKVDRFIETVEQQPSVKHD